LHVFFALQESMISKMFLDLTAVWQDSRKRDQPPLLYKSKGLRLKMQVNFDKF